MVYFVCDRVGLEAGVQLVWRPGKAVVVWWKKKTVLVLLCIYCLVVVGILWCELMMRNITDRHKTTGGAG